MLFISLITVGILSCTNLISVTVTGLKPRTVKLRGTIYMSEIFKLVNYAWTRYRDSVDNTVENSSVFSLILRWMPSGRGCGQ